MEWLIANWDSIIEGIKVVVGAPSDTPESLIQDYLEGTLVTASNLCDH